MVKKAIFFLALFSAFGVLSNVAIFYNPNSSPVSNVVTDYRVSVNEAEYQGRPDVIVMDDFPPGVDLKAARYDGANVVNLTQQQIDRIAATNALLIAQLNALREQKAREFSKQNWLTRKDESAVAFRALSIVILNEINNLRTNQIPPLQPRTLIQLRNAIQAEIDNQ